MGDGVRAGGRVKFDFDGALRLARQLWSLADDLGTEGRGRRDKADTALSTWEGTYATQFSGRRDDEITSWVAVASGLRDDARSWAAAWAAAMDQQNKNNRAAEVERVSEERSLLQKGVDFFNGDDSHDKVAVPDPVPVPQPPSFLATATETTYR